MKKTNGPGKGKKATAKKSPAKKSSQIQVPAGNGVSRYTSTSSAAGKRVAKAKQALEIRKRGGRLLQGEKNAIRKSFNTTKVRKSMPTTKKK